MSYSFTKQPSKIDRTTIADGDALQTNILATLVDNDNTLLLSENETKPIIDSVHATVKSYSADWDNNKIHGFSAVTVEDDTLDTVSTIVGASKFASTAALSAGSHMSLTVDNTTAFIDIDATETEQLSSYFKLYRLLWFI